MASNETGEELQDDQQQLDELDLTPYEEDDDTTLHRKLVAAKMARKRAEEDLKLLCNRIGLLKQEEGKAVKKIDETRKRASDIVGQRRRNMELAQQKLERQRQKLEEQAQLTQQHLHTKEDGNHRVQQNKNMAYTRTKQDALETKMDKQMNRQLWLQQKHQKEQEAQNVKILIKLQQQEAQTKRQMDFHDRQNRTRAQMEEKMNREAHEQGMYEAEVGRMEREELELINRLKNTKLVEEQAHQQLESAINDPLQQTSVTMSQRKGTSSGQKARR